jgi:hypothetical protein
MSAGKPVWNVNKLSSGLVEVRCPWRNAADWEQWFLLTSDRHWDNPKSDRDLQEKHLNQAIASGAGIIDGGDFFCAMQGTGDPRGNKSDIRPEHNNANYLDSLVETASDWVQYWDQHFIMIGRGNHETKVTARKETDLTERLCRNMGDRGSPVVAGAYNSWVRFRFAQGDGGAVRTFNLKIYHGSGGGGATTRGAQQINTRATWWPDADIVMSGHIHHAWHIPVMRERLSRDGEVKEEIQHHISCPTYKREWGGGGFAVERGFGPRPIGAYWLRFHRGAHGEVVVEVIFAT